MKEAQFLGTLLPSHPDFIPIIQAIREKYNLPEISPDDDRLYIAFSYGLAFAAECDRFSIGRAYLVAEVPLNPQS